MAVKIPQFVADSTLPTTARQHTPGAASFGAEAIEGLGEVGKQALSVIAQAEEQKADLLRSSMLMDTVNQAKVAYKDFEVQQEENPNPETHVEERDAYTRKLNDSLISKINDPIVKKAAITHLGNLRDESIVRARDEARKLAVHAAIGSSDQTLDIIDQQFADNILDPEVRQESLDGYDVVHESLVTGGVMTPDKAYEQQKKRLSDAYVKGVDNLIAADPSTARKFLLDNADEVRERAGGDHWLTLLTKARSQIEHEETIEHTRLARVSETNRELFHRKIYTTTGDKALADLETAVGVAVDMKQLKGGDAEHLRDTIRKLRVGGGISDPETLKNFEHTLYSTMGEGISFDAIYAKVGEGISAEDGRRLAGLKESLEGRKGVLGHSISLIEKAVNPGMMEKWTKTDKTTYTVAVQELMQRTNNGNLDPKKINEIGFEIANRLNRSRTMAEGTNPFKSMDDLDSAIRSGRVSEDAIDKYADAMSLPPRWSTWDKVSVDWRDGRISEELARALHRRMFPAPPTKKGNK